MKISVIIATYNSDKYLGRAVRSAIDQSLPTSNFEVIVIDDGSADHTQDILDNFADSVRVIRHEENMGLAYSCNEGLKKALGEYVIRLDADDYINRHTLLATSLILDYNKDLHFVWTDYLVENRDMESTGQSRELVRNNVLNPARMLAAGVLFRKSVIERVGLYDENLSGVEGEDLLIRILSSPEDYRGFYLPLPLYRYIRHDNNMTNDERAMRQGYVKLARKIGNAE